MVQPLSSTESPELALPSVGCCLDLRSRHGGFLLTLRSTMAAPHLLAMCLDILFGFRHVFRFSSCGRVSSWGAPAIPPLRLCLWNLEPCS